MEKELYQIGEAGNNINDMLREYLGTLRPRSGGPRRLVLMHCPTFNLDTFKQEVLKSSGYYAYPPRGLQCLATVVEELGIEVDIVDLNYLLLERLMKFDRSAKPDAYKELLNIVSEYEENNPDVWMYGVSTGVIVSNVFTVERHPYTEILKQLMARPDRLVLTGGAVATVEAKNILKHQLAHVVLKGEAEDRLRYLMSLIFDIPDMMETAGIAFQGDAGYAETTGTSEMVDFRQSVIDTYKQIPVENYHKVGCLSPFSRLVGTDIPFGSLQLNRGCRMRCSFCGLTQYRGSNKVCQYPVETLMEELRYLVNERGIRHFEWLDEDLLANRNAILDVLHQIEKEKLPVTWAANIGVIAVYLDEEILDAMARSNCVGFRIGVESGNEEMLKKIRKPLTKPKLRKVCERLRLYKDIFVASCWIVGFPEERYHQIFETLQFALELNLSWAQIAIYQDIQETDEDDDSNDVNGESLDLSYKKKENSKIADFIPSVEKVVGSSQKDESHVRQLRAVEIFKLPSEKPHDPQIKDQLWFAFNLIINYITNKNLRPGGNIEHFSRWLKGLQMTYPDHAVMSLFQALALTVKGDGKAADAEWNKAVHLRDTSPHWVEKFDLFDLNRVIEAHPKNAEAVCAVLDELLASYGLPFEYTRCS